MRCLRLGSVLELPATVDPATTLSTQLGALRWLITFFLIELLQALEKLCISNNDAPAAVLGHVGEPSVLIQPQSGHWRDWLLFSHHSALGKRRQHERQVIDPLKRASMVMCCMQQPLFTSSTGCAQDAVPLPRWHVEQENGCSRPTTRARPSPTASGAMPFGNQRAEQAKPQIAPKQPKLLNRPVYPGPSHHAHKG
jgi:hypothetical protein